MRLNRTALLIFVLMVLTGISAVVARPDGKALHVEAAFTLNELIPRHFGDWQEDTQSITPLVNPAVKKFLEETYSQILTRTYSNAEGYRIMLSLAYGSDQRGYLRAHEPESCYAGAGFSIRGIVPSRITTPFGDIPVKRLFAVKRAREEPVTYWTKVGNIAVKGWQRKLVELSYTMTGRIPDGLLFRISSIDGDQARAHQMQDQFVTQLLQNLPPADRHRVAGL